MRYLLRTYLFNVFGLWLSSQFVPMLVVTGGVQGILGAGVVFTALTVLIRPILKILFLPINIITFGLLSWVVHVILLYLLTILATNVNVNPWDFPGVTWSGFVIPPTHLSYPFALIISSFSLTLTTNVLQHLIEE